MQFLTSLMIACGLSSAVLAAPSSRPFYNANGIRATILSEKLWDKNGYVGYDVLVRINGDVDLFGVVCEDTYYGDVGYRVRLMDPTGQFIMRDTFIEPFGPRYRGVIGFDQDLFHNVCYDDNRY